MAKILITGANSYIGASLIPALLREGHKVSGLISGSSFSSILNGLRFEIHFGDTNNKQALQRAMEGVDTVFHFAGVFSKNEKKWRIIEKVNIEGTDNVLKLATQAGVKRIVALSLPQTNGCNFHLTEPPRNEKSEFNLDHLKIPVYSSNIISESLLVEGHTSGKIETVLVAPTVVFGHGDTPENSKRIRLLAAQGRLWTSTPGGVSVVDLDDAVEGILLAWKKGRSGEKYILGGQNCLNKELVVNLARLAKSKKPIFEIPQWAFGRYSTFLRFMEETFSFLPWSRDFYQIAGLYQWYDSQKAIDELAYRSHSLEYALLKSVSWMQSQGQIE